jgi:hypothetical protein
MTAVSDTSHDFYVALALALNSIFVSPLTLAASDQKRGVDLVFRAVGRSILKPIIFWPIAGILFAFLAFLLPVPVGHAECRHSRSCRCRHRS